MFQSNYSSVEICAGAGGQALGLENAGFDHKALVEIDPHCCETLRTNRKSWNVVETDARDFLDIARKYAGVDLFSGGIPCPPFSVAGKQLGADDERNLFPTFFQLASILKPKFLLVENVKGLLSPKFDTYRRWVDDELEKLGFVPQWKLILASDFGVPQLRPRVAMVACRPEYTHYFDWPTENEEATPTVGETLIDLMSKDGWVGAKQWAKNANKIAPTIVGGSKKHGGPDLGPTRARRAWAELGVEGKSLANCAPPPDFDGVPRLTTEMVARLQGFPDDWVFWGKKTNAYRQIGNAFPPPVAEALGRSIISALNAVNLRQKDVA